MTVTSPNPIVYSKETPLPLYKETNFQTTPMGKIPKDWQTMKLGDKEVSDDIFYGITAKATQIKSGLKMLRTTDIKDYSVNWHTLPYCEVTERRDNIEKYLLKRGEIVIARAGTVGVSVLVEEDFNDIVYGSYLIKVKLTEKMLPKFVHYYLQSDIYGRHISKAQGSTLKNINLPLLRSLDVPVPPYEEQEAIVGVLGVVDCAIEFADRIIAKTERLKRGLMQQLLTRGIGHTETKQTPIGTIPKEWNLVELRELVSDVQNGFASGKRDEKGIAQIRMNNLTTDGRLLLDSYLKVPVPEKISRWLLKPTDFLFNNTNSIDLVGKSAIFKGAPFPCTFSNHFTRIRFKEDIVNPELILYHFITQWEKGYFRSVAIRHVGQAAVHTEYLLRLKIPLPPLSEQEKIVEILSATNHKLELERLERQRLERIKRGLMDLLLTGKVRIKVD